MPKFVFKKIIILKLTFIFFCMLGFSAEQNLAEKKSGYVGLRPLPRYEADLKTVHGGPWTGLPTFDQQGGNYPFVAEHVDVIKGWDKGDFKTKKMFFEFYWGQSQTSDNLEPKKNRLVRMIRKWESKGYEIEHILICREYYNEVLRGNLNAIPGPFEEDTRILFAKDVDAIRKLFRAAHQQGLVKNENYKLFQLVEDSDFFAIDPRAQAIIKKMEGVAYEAHQFNRHWPLETGWSEPGKVVTGAKWTIDQGLEYIFYYGPIIWKSDQYYEFIERDWLQKFWHAGLPKHHPLMHYYLNTFPHLHGRGRPLGPESDPHSVLGFTKWLIHEIKMVPTKEVQDPKLNKP